MGVEVEAREFKGTTICQEKPNGSDHFHLSVPMGRLLFGIISDWIPTILGDGEKFEAFALPDGQEGSCVKIVTDDGKRNTARTSSWPGGM